MVDDMGFSDIGSYGSEIPTPNLDNLAENGIRFTQFYNAARCCPTRASLLTGLYPHQTGIGFMTTDSGEGQYPSYDGDLNDNCVTIAQLLQGQGYRTMMAGKWHVTKHIGYWDGSDLNSKHNWPLQRGFDKFYGLVTGTSSYFTPQLAEGNEPIDNVGGEGYYLTDDISNKAAEYIEESIDDGENFFMYLAYTAPHWPMHALPEDIKKYENRYVEGWDKLRSERYKRLLELGIIDDSTKLTPRDPESVSWENAENKEWEARRMAVYAAMIDRMDQGIGKVLKKIEDMGEKENTIVMFLSDNGGSAERVYRPYKYYAPAETWDGRKVHRGTTPEIMPGPDTTFQAYGLSWANASNTPFRLFKKFAHEGGISTPLIVSWPAEIKNPGIITSQPGHVMDIMATCLDVASISYPAEFNGNKITPLEGKSLMPILRGNQRDGHEYICWEHRGNRAIRKSKWKLVSYYNGAAETVEAKGGVWELYDIENDRSELVNLSGKFPTIVQELTELYDKWASKNGVVAWSELP